MTRRSGISLVEVLVSIGVVAVGILGVVTLLPLGLQQTKQGTVADRAAAAGRRAWREFQVRGMDHVESWQVDTTMGEFPYEAVAIDPWWRTRDPSVSAFPIGGAIPMNRISLRDIGTTERALADEIFYIQDDLNFVASPLEGALPIQVDEATGLPWLATDDHPATTPAKRAFGGSSEDAAAGGFSWFATLVPHKNRRSDLVTLSIVVVHQRVDPSISLPNTDEPTERTLQCDVHHGMGGADVTLSFTGSERDARAYLKTGRNRWIMLSGSRDGDYFQWYRVLTAGPIVEHQGQWKRDLTLIGADWPVDSSTQATLVRGAVAVFERTITLKASTIQ